mgnify:CR=1 FL=1
MKIFESLDKVSNEEMESKILKKWKSEDILNKTMFPCCNYALLYLP